MDTNGLIKNWRQNSIILYHNGPIFRYTSDKILNLVSSQDQNQSKKVKFYIEQIFQM